MSLRLHCNRYCMWGEKISYKLCRSPCRYRDIILVIGAEEVSVWWLSMSGSGGCADDGSVLSRPSQFTVGRCIMNSEEASMNNIGKSTGIINS